MHHNLIISFLQTVFLILSLMGFLLLTFLNGIPMSQKLIIALSSPILIAGIFLISWLNNRKIIRFVPEKIRITNTFIQIDDDRFSIGEIRQIRMEDIGELRYLRIDSADRSINYCMAHNISGNNLLCYLDYSALYRSPDTFMRQIGKRMQ